jgi:hypothetical protein
MGAHQIGVVFLAIALSSFGCKQRRTRSEVEGKNMTAGGGSKRFLR